MKNVEFKISTLKASIPVLILIILSSYRTLVLLKEYGAPIGDIVAYKDIDVMIGIFIGTLLPVCFVIAAFMSLPQIPIKIRLTDKKIQYKSWIMRNFIEINWKDIQDYKNKFWGIRINTLDKRNGLVLFLFSKRAKMTVLNKLSEIN